ncbi:hypothetical protein WJX81_006428 [Elliptochloris bilobata]|uniref:Cytoplasmic tRNA 2-thiolation protein 1 n=1 Tax=Elliptochloris bilobata TaxID=381761 RepID=A0AAW1RPK0_9CHLO
MAPKQGPKRMPEKRVEGNDERGVRLEAENAARADAARRRAELLRQRLLEQQRREQECARVNGIKLHMDWRSVMRNAKTEELRGAVSSLAQRFERAIDRRDLLIQRLDADLGEGEEQQATVVRAHMALVAQLLALQRARLDATLRQHFAEAQEEEKRFSEDRGAADASHAAALHDAAAVTSAAQAAWAGAEAEARAELEAAREEQRHNASEALNVLKLSLEAQIAEVRRTSAAALETYTRSTEAKDKARLAEAIAHWRAKAAAAAREWEARNRALAAERAAAARHHRALKAALERFRAQQAERMRELSVRSAAIEGALRARLATADRIVRLAALCRKAESEAERETGWCHALDARGLPVPRARLLDNAYRRYNKVLLDVLALEQERARLHKANSAMRATLSGLLRGASISPTSLDGPRNGLLHVKSCCCQAQRAVLKRPKTRQQLCRECFYAALESEVHETIVANELFQPGERVAVAASGGKDSTVLAHMMTVLNKRHGYGLDLFLLSIDEGISGYRDDSLETVKRNEAQYGIPLTVLSYKALYGWTMDEIVAEIGHRNNCTFCGVFRRQALDRGAALMKADKLATGHNADDVAETVLLNMLRGDVPRLGRCAAIFTGEQGALPRVKPFKYTYEKEIVMYAYFKRLDYFSTECLYAPFAARGAARDFVKDLEAARPQAIVDLIRSAETMRIDRSAAGEQLPLAGSCERCGYITSQAVCKVCVLLEGLNRGRPGQGVGRAGQRRGARSDAPSALSTHARSRGCRVRNRLC